MTELTSFFTALNSLSPLAVIALLGTIIFLLVKGKTGVGDKVDALANNHLHCLPEILEALQRIEVKMSEEFAYLRAKINGK